MKQLIKKSNYSFCFQHWANKPYAAFNSIKKKFKIGVLSVCYTMITLASQDVFAQTDTLVKNKTVLLNEATVTATRQQVYSDAARIVNVFTKDEIKEMPVRTIQDLLKNVSGIDVRSRGGEGVQAGISIRGGTLDQVLILLNGINITDPQTGNYNLNIPVDLSTVERIEVLQGSGSRILGPNAFSGAINIITSKSDSNSLQLKLSGGQNNYLAPSVNANFKHKQLSANAAISHSQSTGYKENTDFRITNYYLQTQYTAQTIGKLEFQGAFQNKAVGANSFYSPAHPNQFDYNHSIFNSLRWEKQYNKINLEASAYWRRHYDRYELIRDSARGRNLHRTDVPGVQTRASVFSSLGKTIVGAEYRHEEIISTKLGTPLANPIDVTFYNDISPRPKYTNGANRNIINYYIDHTVYIDKFSLSAGLLGSWSSDYGNNIYTGADAGYRLSPYTKLYAGVNQSLRLPTYTELFYTGEGYIGNSDLKPEKALTYEGGVKYAKNLFSSHVSIYYRQGKNIIDWLKLQDKDPWESHNMTDVNAWGIELSGAYIPVKSWVKRIQLSGAWQDVDKGAQNYISKYVLDYLKYKVNAGIDHTVFFDNILASWRFSYHDREGTYTDFKSGKETVYTPFALVDFKLIYTTPQYNVFIEASNLFDKKYMDIANIEQVGFWLKAGIQVTIGK